ncbi:UNVERIFIED_CONTAM: hypothetical protein Sangu_1443800, partial [Sesamum angustifolium]
RASGQFFPAISASFAGGPPPLSSPPHDEQLPHTRILHGHPFRHGLFFGRFASQSSNPSTQLSDSPADSANSTQLVLLLQSTIQPPTESPSAPIQPIRPAPAPQRTSAEVASSLPSQNHRTLLPEDLRKSFLANSHPRPLGVKSEYNGVHTLSFTDEATHPLASHLRFAIVGKFSHGAPPYRLMHKLVAGFGIQREASHFE